MKRALCIAALAALLANPGDLSSAAAPQIYLKARAELTDAVMTLADICVIEADEQNTEILAAIAVPEEDYADWLIDSSEVRALLAARGFAGVRIYGSAVKIERPGVITESDVPARGQMTVKSGMRVTVFYEKRGIRIERAGTAMNGGREGDRIRVRLGRGRVVAGTAVSGGMVELE